MSIQSVTINGTAFCGSTNPQLQSGLAANSFTINGSNLPTNINNTDVEFEFPTMGYTVNADSPLGSHSSTSISGTFTYDPSGSGAPMKPPNDPSAGAGAPLIPPTVGLMVTVKQNGGTFPASGTCNVNKPTS